MADKTSGIPIQHQWNMTGGLPHAVLNVGVLGTPMSGSYLTYAIAGKNLRDRESGPQADQVMNDDIQAMYGMWREGRV